MLCRSCRRAIAPSKASSHNLVVARASIASFSVATRNYSSSTVSTQTKTSIPAFACQSLSLSTSRLTSARRLASTKRAYSSATSETPSTLAKPDHLDAAESTIWDKLVAEFSPSELVVQDVSGGCGSMYAIDITSAKFKGANMLKQQRMVNAVLADMMKQWHGVQLRTKST